MHKYKNKDFYLSAFLLASGLRLSDHFRTGSITVFEFNESDDLHQLVNEYYKMSGKITPKKYGESLRKLKSIIHNAALESNKELRNEFPKNQRERI